MPGTKRSSLLILGTDDGETKTVFQRRQTSEYLEHVKRVGVELRHLLAAVDHLVPAFPPSTHRKVQLKTINVPSPGTESVTWTLDTEC